MTNHQTDSDSINTENKDKIDKTLEDLNVSRTETGKDQTQKSDTEGSNSSSKNLDEETD